MRIGLDVDGVFSDFNTSFIALIKQQTGRHLPPVSPTYPDVWNYHKAGGVTDEEDKALWSHIKNSAFWRDLPPLREAWRALLDLSVWRTAGHELYFITSRPGQYGKAQTEEWLDFYGMEHPTVLIAANEAAKGQLAVGLKLDAFLDDKPENCAAVLNATKVQVAYDGVMSLEPFYRYPCAVFLFDAPYNKHYNDPAVTRVVTIQEMLSSLLQESDARLVAA